MPQERVSVNPRQFGLPEIDTLYELGEIVLPRCYQVREAVDVVSHWPEDVAEASGKSRQTVHLRTIGVPGALPLTHSRHHLQALMRALFWTLSGQSDMGPSVGWPPELFRSVPLTFLEELANYFDLFGQDDGIVFRLQLGRKLVREAVRDVEKSGEKFTNASVMLAFEKNFLRATSKPFHGKSITTFVGTGQAIISDTAAQHSKTIADAPPKSVLERLKEYNSRK
jgi:hypothetical protein